MRLLFALFFLLGFVVGVSHLEGHRFPASVTGYISDVRGEKSERYYEVYLIPPQGEVKVDYRGKIFNGQLTREFQQRYRDDFGYIDNDGLTYAANKFTQFDENRGRTSGAETINAKRRTYAEYMVKRLGEWHVDNYFKSEPSMRAVYELKEQLSNVKVEVGKSTRLNLHYSFADNSAEIVAENPYCDAKIRIEMDPKAFGPGQILENRLYVGQQVTPRTYIRGMMTQKTSLSGVEWWTSYGNGLSSSLTATTPYQKVNGVTPETSLGAAIQHAF